MVYNHPPIWQALAFLAALVLVLYLVASPYWSKGGPPTHDDFQTRCAGFWQAHHRGRKSQGRPLDRLPAVP